MALAVAVEVAVVLVWVGVLEKFKTTGPKMLMCLPTGYVWHIIMILKSSKTQILGSIFIIYCITPRVIEVTNKLPARLVDEGETAWKRVVWHFFKRNDIFIC